MTSSINQHEPSRPSASHSTLDLDRIIGKNVKTVEYQDAGKVMSILENEDAVLISSEGAHGTYNYKVPKNCIHGFNGLQVMLSISRTEMAEYEINDLSKYAGQSNSIKTEEKGEEKEITVPIIGEKLKISKKIVTDEAALIKEPVTETKIIEVSIMHEVLVLDKRPVAGEGNTKISENPPPRNTRTEIHIPLIQETIKVKKQPYVKEEIVVRKKPITETRTVNESVISEKADMDNNNNIGSTIGLTR